MTAGSLALALATQFMMGYNPCPWCIAQRIAYLVIAVLALGATLVGRGAPHIPAWRSNTTRLLLLLCAVFGGLALWAALYQHFVAAPAGSCAFTWPDRMLMRYGLDTLAPWFFQATAACDEADRALFGLPYSIWSALLAVLVVVASVLAILQTRRPSGMFTSRRG